MKSLYLKKPSNPFNSRKQSQAPRQKSPLLNDQDLQSIPRGSPRVAKVRILDSPERSNKFSTVVSYH